MDLNTLIADAKTRSLKPKPRKKKADTAKAAFRKTREELRKITLAQCEPVSVHLRVTQQTCTCGNIYRSQNNVPLVKKVSSVLDHYEPAKDMNALSDLPHLTEVQEIKIPYCEACYPCTATNGEAEVIHVEAKAKA